MSFSTRSPAPSRRSPALLRRSLALARPQASCWPPHSSSLVRPTRRSTSRTQPAARPTPRRADPLPPPRPRARTSPRPGRRRQRRTRWSSQFSDPQWLQVDLGASTRSARWCCSGRARTGRRTRSRPVPTAPPGRTSTHHHRRGRHRNAHVSGTGRYIRMNGTARAAATATRCGSSKVLTTGGSTTAAGRRRPTRATRTSARTSTSSTRRRRARPSRTGSTSSSPAGDQPVRPGALRGALQAGHLHRRRQPRLLHPGRRPRHVARRRQPQRPRARRGGLDEGNGNATQNFWRSAENLSVTLPAGTIERWAVSQAAPYRRMHLKGAATRSSSGTAATAGRRGGLMADTKIDGAVVSGSQQQWYSRNSEFGTAGPARSGTWCSRACRAPRRPTSRTRRTRSSPRPR